VKWDYDKARLYLYKHIWQIVTVACPRWINIPYYLHDDVNTEMFMLVDDLFRNIFEDTKQLDIITVDGEHERWTRFEKYYYPHQAYWYIRFVVNKRIISYFTNRRDDINNSMISIGDILESEYLTENMADLNKQISCEMLLWLVTNTYMNLDVIDRFVFASVFLKNKTYKQVSALLREEWLDYSAYRVGKIAKWLLATMKEVAEKSDIELDDVL